MELRHLRLPGDLGPAIVKSQSPVVASYAPPGQDAAAAERDARRKEAEAAAGSFGVLPFE